MAQLFIDTASISNLEITRSYIGSGSTSFNKENSFLRVNNGVRQGIDNRTFGTSDNSRSHIEGYNNSDTPGTCHVEGYNNTALVNSNTGHIEGANNSSRVLFSHIEGTNNNSNDQNNTTLASNHIEGGFNTGSMGWGRHHIEGYNNKITIGSRAVSHFEGANNTYVGSVAFNSCHIEGYNSNINAAMFFDYSHIEGGNHTAPFHPTSRPISGEHSHIEGSNNQLIFSNGSSKANHIEGSNNIISASSSAPIANSNHICGVSCSSYLNNVNSFMSGLGSQTYYFGFTSHISGQFNTSSVSSYSNISPSTNAVWYNFTIGGGLNNSTRANIFEVAIISTASVYQTNRTSSIMLPWVSESGEFASDLLAAAGGIPLGGFYRTGNNLKIRLS